MSEWRPIETAPKGNILACNGEYYDSVEWIFYDPDAEAGFRFFNVNSHNYSRDDVWTHWIPLPKPPEAT